MGNCFTNLFALASQLSKQYHDQLQDYEMYGVLLNLIDPDMYDLD